MTPHQAEMAFAPAPAMKSTPLTIDQRFAAYHRRHPEIARELARMALAVKESGDATQIGIAMIWEALRYSHATSGNPDRPKLPNDYRALYARHLMDTYPELATFFTTRPRRSIQ